MKCKDCHQRNGHAKGCILRKPNCLHCGKGAQCRPGGLCWTCYYVPDRESAAVRNVMATPAAERPMILTRAWTNGTE